jgi:DNA processing protein
MSDVAIRDRLLAYALLGYITPARARLLLDAGFSSNASARFIKQGLRIDDPDREREVREPLTVERVQRGLALYRDSSLTLADDGYPELLRHLPDPPLALFYRGDTALLKKPAAAMVGSRRASAYGLNAARHLAAQLAAAGVAVVSGLARGIDGAAHQAALDAGGATIAVLGTGIDVVYPRSHRKLFNAIEERGLIVTEFAPGMPPLSANFPIRNRIISGLAMATVIVEATGRSGSLITARTAAEQGRNVCAVPGTIFAPGAEGTNRLIQYGAKLVHDVNDILEEVPGSPRVASVPEIAPDSPLREVLDVFARDEATHIDAAAEKLKTSVAAVSDAVLQLELAGWLQAMPGSRWTRVR